MNTVNLQAQYLKNFVPADRIDPTLRYEVIASDTLDGEVCLGYEVIEGYDYGDPDKLELAEVWIGYVELSQHIDSATLNCLRCELIKDIREEQAHV